MIFCSVHSIKFGSHYDSYSAKVIGRFICIKIIVSKALRITSYPVVFVLTLQKYEAVVIFN